MCSYDFTHTFVLWTLRSHLSCYLESFYMLAHTHVFTEGRTSWPQFPFAGLAYVSSIAPVHVL